MTHFRLHCACQERSGGEGNKFGTPPTRCWHRENQVLEEARKWRRTWRQSDYPYSKGVDILLMPQNLAWAQHLVGGVPNLFPPPPLLSWHAQCRRKWVVKTTYKVLQKCCMNKSIARKPGSQEARKWTWRVVGPGCIGVEGIFLGCESLCLGLG